MNPRDTAYSLASKTGFDTFQIDNHFARFLMEQAIVELDYPEALENYRAARAIIDRQSRDERRHYPYAVATRYQDFIDRFGRKMNLTEVAEFAEASGRLLRRMQSLSEYRRNHRNVVDCKRSMEYVISVCRELINSRNVKDGN